MSTTLLAPVDKTTLPVEARTWTDRVRDLAIPDTESCTQGSFLLRSIKGVRLDIQRWFAPHLEAATETKRKAEAARKALADECDRMEAPLVAAEATVKQALLAWEADQERRQREEEARLQALAQAEAETQVLAAAAALEREAVATGDAEMLDEAQALLAQPVEAPTVVVKATVAKVQGVVYRDNWTVHPTIDVKKLAAAVAAGTAPANFLTPNLPALRQWARATKGGQPLPGVQVINDRQIAASA
jgi:alanyl-tRNA synthetase